MQDLKQGGSIASEWLCFDRCMCLARVLAAAQEFKIHHEGLMYGNATLDLTSAGNLATSSYSKLLFGEGCLRAEQSTCYTPGSAYYQVLAPSILADACSLVLPRPLLLSSLPASSQEASGTLLRANISILYVGRSAA